MFSTIKMEVSKSNTATKKREAIGTVDIYVPTLADAGIVDAVQAVDEKTKEAIADDSGLPLYVSDIHNWLQNAIYTQVKASARNRLKPQSLELKSALGIATDWTMLTAENTGSGNGEALAINRELKASFATWVSTLGKSANAQAMLTDLFNSKDGLRVQDVSIKSKMAGYVADYAATLKAETLTRYEASIQKVLDICDETLEADDF